MAKVTRGNAQEWDTVQTLSDGASEFFEKRAYFGRYTFATAQEKFLKKFPEYEFVSKPFHGSGGYLVDPDGNTVELRPAMPAQKSDAPAVKPKKVSRNDWLL